MKLPPDIKGLSLHFGRSIKESNKKPKKKPPNFIYL